VKPEARTILLADHVYRDVETGKCIIAGTFNRIGADRFPAVHPSASLYLNLTDFLGKVNLKVRLVKGRTDEVLGEKSFEVESSNKLGSCEVTVRLNNLNFPEPGMYAIEVYSDEEYLGRLPLELVLHASGPAGGD
jgi:hypothetical protein